MPLPLPYLLRSLHHSHSYSRSSLLRYAATHLCRSMATTTTNSASSSVAAGGEPISPATTRLGWIGTGVMGRSMCAHLIRAGYTLIVFNRTLSKAQALLDMGAHLAPSPSAVASQSDIVFSIVGYPSDVRSVLLDPASGALSSLRPGGVLVDMTTSDPSLAAEIATSAASKGCASVDAPVSGGDRGAKNAALAIFAGGDEPVVHRLAPLFNLLGKVNYMGGPGKGQFAKLANQITIASTMVGLIEGMVYAHKAGLDVCLYLKAISSGAAGSKSLDLYGSRILKRDFEPGFYVNHFVKDLGICLRECENMGLSLPGLALAHQLYLSLIAHGEGNLGTQALVLALERLNNVSLDSGTSAAEPS
ncbi:probable 3-hydroxyisobutyrate dehydrogenase-like 1, mitochondrial [Malania oleifera]|uniref:probable 3-hydroxyisobutyrate dehydrogenase-like 1, mitochondrial n=1 Tax=Malania oleifera TaxID=397392 RepID=UPI0025AE4127|nr:probable 3-hydroxyisobutyrate dehydrogenase-like 1, mitochondrial [Malania oleifera]